MSGDVFLAATAGRPKARRRTEMFEKLSERPVAEVQKEQVARWKEEDLLGKCVSTREGQPAYVF